MVEDVLVDLAAYADIEGIDWPSLNAQGQGLMQSEAYLQALDERWERFYSVAETLAITDAEWEETTAEEARDAWTEVRDAMTDKAGLMLDALLDGKFSVAYDHAATIWTGSLKKLVVATSHVSHRNLTAHQDGTLYWAIETGALTVTEVEEEASSIARLWDCVVKLDQWNALNEFKKPEYGVGQTPQQATVGRVIVRGLPFVITSIGIAAVIAAVIVWLSYLSDRNSQIDKFCFNEDGSVREGRPAWCDEPNQGMQDPLAVFLKPFTEAGKRLATGLSIVAGIAVAVWAGSIIVPKLLAGAAKRRAAA